MNVLDPSSFDWSQSPPLSSFNAVATTSVSYVVLVVVATVCSKKKYDNHDDDDDEGVAVAAATTTATRRWKPWFGNSDLQTAVLLHNTILVVSSAIMFRGVIIESIHRLSQPSSEGESKSSWPPFLFCEDPHGELAGRGSLYYWSYVYYLSKYYELLDTFLQLARGKPPPHFVLHVYHHAVVLWMAWAWLEYKQSLQFIGLAFNTAVHVAMYTYFLQRALTKTPPKWKSYVTLFQITQFAFSFVCLLCTLFIAFVQKHQCSGMKALGFNCVFNLTLLYSFVGVFVSGKKKRNTSVESKKL